MDSRSAKQRAADCRKKHGRHDWRFVGQYGHEKGSGYGTVLNYQCTRCGATQRRVERRGN